MFKHQFFMKQTAAAVIAFVLLVVAPVFAVNAQESTWYTGYTEWRTEVQINDQFSIPNTTLRQVSNLSVDLLPDGSVQVMFDLTLSRRNGESTTVNGIIAILIGLVRDDGTVVYSVDDVQTQGSGDPIPTESISFLFISSAWNRYVRGVFRELPRPMEFVVADDAMAARPQG